MTMTLYEIFVEAISDLDLSAYNSAKEVCRTVAEARDLNLESMYAAVRREVGSAPSMGELAALAEDTSPPPDAEEEFGFEAPDEPRGWESRNKRYFYNEVDDVYVFWLPFHRGASVVVDGEDIREAKRRYSRWEESGEEETINQVATAFGWPREWFVQMKTELGWTHDQDPFTEQEHRKAVEGERDLLRDLVSMHRAQLERDAKKRKWRQTIEDARAWRDLQEGSVGKLIEWAEDKDFSSPPATSGVQVDLAGEDNLAVIQPADVHLGKREERGRGLSLEEYKTAIIETIDALAQSARASEAVLVLGNDLFHVDSLNETTTRGTAQDLNCSVPQLVSAGHEVAVEAVKVCMQYFANTRIVVVRSNHDDYGTLHLYEMLRLLTEHWSGVEMHDRDWPKYRQYMKYGKNLLGFCHGQGVKAKDLSDLMAGEARDLMSSTAFSYWFTAHLHYAADHKISEDAGEGPVHMFQAPSPSTTDRWHGEKGFTLARRMAVCYTFHRRRGHVGRRFEPIPLSGE